MKIGLRSTYETTTGVHLEGCVMNTFNEAAADLHKALVELWQEIATALRLEDAVRIIARFLRRRGA